MMIETCEKLIKYCLVLGLIVSGIFYFSSNAYAFSVFGGEGKALEIGHGSSSSASLGSGTAVVKNNVRYVAYSGPDAPPGYVAAYEAVSGKKLWVAMVYDAPHGAKPANIKSITLQQNGMLLVENDSGARYIFDPRDQTVRPAH